MSVCGTRCGRHRWPEYNHGKSPVIKPADVKKTSAKSPPTTTQVNHTMDPFVAGYANAQVSPVAWSETGHHTMGGRISTSQRGTGMGYVAKTNLGLISHD